MKASFPKTMTVKQRASLAVLVQSEMASDAEHELADRLGLKLFPSAQLGKRNIPDYVMEISEAGLSLRGLQHSNLGRLQVDFASHKLKWRSRQPLQSQLLGKAAGLKGKSDLCILDATAGLGTDGFLLSQAGCKVTMLERSPIVFALLQDGLHRAKKSPGTVRDVAERINLLPLDFLAYAPEKQTFDMVYLDPMFAIRRNTARAGKSMYFLQQLLPEGNADTSKSVKSSHSELPEMLNRARQLARQRVVLKRTRLAPVCGIPEPDIRFKGSSSRFDVYLAS
ncbi:MAG: class I SAM-dependent methyltransferase [Gammaproteobacteria bacterium]|nr:class I SAM-dependent methyltransferase [Gammaproteobacteria bacterium]